MNEAKFQELVKKLTKPSSIWSPRFFTWEELESMTPSQLSKVTLEMMKFTSPGSYTLRPDLFDLIDYLDKKVTIPEDPHLEKYLHMTASLVCLTQLQGYNFSVTSLPERLTKHLTRIVGSHPFEVSSMETEPSLQIATFLTYPILEGVIRRKLSEFVSVEGIVQKDFAVSSPKGKVKLYKCGDHISNLDHELQLLEKKTTSSSLKAILSHIKENRPLFQEIHDWRNPLLHGELTASWHGLTLLLLTYIILLER